MHTLSSGTTRTTSRFTARVIRTDDALARFHEAWDSLWAADKATDLFGSPGWFANWWRHFGGKSGEVALVVNDGNEFVPVAGSDWRMHVLAIEDPADGSTLAVLPLVRVQGRFNRWQGRILATPANGHGPRVALAARRFDAPIVQAFCDALVSDRSWDLLMLDGLSCADPRVAAVVTELHARRLSIRADTRWTQAFLQHPGSFEALLDARSRQFRKHYRQNERSLEKLGAIQVDTFTGDSSAEGFQRFVEIDAASWKSTGGESLANAPAVLAYYEDLVSRLAPAGQAEVWTLSIGGVPAAAFICLCDQRVRYCLKTSYSQQFSGSTRISPSQVLLGRIIEHCADHDTRHVDFLGRLPFVDRWADREIEMTHLVLARPLHARLLQRLRSLARSLLARTEHQDPNQRTDR